MNRPSHSSWQRRAESADEPPLSMGQPDFPARINPIETPGEGPPAAQPADYSVDVEYPSAAVGPLTMDVPQWLRSTIYLDVLSGLGVVGRVRYHRLTDHYRQ